MSVSKTDSQSRWLQLDKLLDEGQYARLAEHLLDFQTAIEQTNHPDLNNLTIAALQICMLCQQCQIEMEWHQKANREVRQRVIELEQQLHTLLNLIVEYGSLKDGQLPAVSVTVTSLQDGRTPEVSERPTLLQRIQDLFNFEPELPTPGLQPSRVVIDALFTSLVENDELLTNLDDRNEALPPPSVEETGSITQPTADGVEISSPVLEEAESVEEVKAPVIPAPGLERKDAAAAPIEKTAQSQETPPSLVVYCLGSFRVFLDDQPVADWPSSKGKAIFKYLVTHREYPIAKEVLMELFWPSAHPDAARNNLNVSIYGLRQALRRNRPDFSHVLFHNDSYLLNPKLHIWVDIEEFMACIKTARILEQRGDLTLAIHKYSAAEALYQGEFLKEDRYEDWLVHQRQRLRDDCLKLLDRLSRIYLDQEDFSACVSACHKMLSIDQCREEAHRRLMHCYCRQDQPYLALRQYHLCVEKLKEELDVSPTESTEILYQRVRKGK